MPRRRLGVVLLVPPPIAHEIDGLRRALAGDGAVGKVGAHITLVPPVNVRQDELGAALAVVRRAAAASGPLTLSLGPVETFLPVNPVAYLAVGGPSSPSLVALRERLLDGPLDRPLSHEFVPHVTVAEELDEDRLLDAVAVLAHYRHAIVTFRLVHVLEEVRDQNGHRVWRPISGLALGPPAVVGRGGLELTIEQHDRVPPDAGDLTIELEPPALVLVGRRDSEVVGLAAADQVVVGGDVAGEGIEDHLRARFDWLADQ